MSALPKEQDDSMLQVQKNFMDRSALLHILLSFSWLGCFPGSWEQFLGVSPFQFAGNTVQRGHF